MKRPGAIYQGSEGRRYLAMYNYNHDISVRLPPELQSAQRVAAISYSKGEKEGNVDVFLLPKNELPIEDRVRIKKTVSGSKDDYRIVQSNGRTSALGDLTVALGINFSTYDIKARVISDLPPEVAEEAINLTAADIAYFCGPSLAKKTRDIPFLETVPSIVPVTSLRRINPTRMLTGGKAEFVPQCVLEANIDFTKGCLTSWVPGQDASFDGESSTDYWHFPWGDCDYCYAADKHKSFPKTIYEFDQQRLLEELKGGARLTYGSDKPVGKPVEILRFGKRTEPWTPFTEDSFVGTLEAMLETGTKGVIVTKFLPFRPEFVDLLRRTKSTVLYSVGGAEEVELGPLAWGATNAFRLEQAAKYREAKVNAAAFYLMHPLFPPTEQDLTQHRFIDKHEILVQYIGARFYRKEDAQKMIAPLINLETRTGCFSLEAIKNFTKYVVNRIHKRENTQAVAPIRGFEGRTDISIWDILKNSNPGQTSLTKEYWWANSYEEHAGILIPRLDRMHPFWGERIGRNVGKTRMCAHDEDKTFCGGCFTKPGTISPTVPFQEKNPVFVELTLGTKLEARIKKKGRGNNRLKKDKNQFKLGM